MIQLESNYVTWSLGAIVLVPVLLVVLSELIDRCRRQENEYTSILVMLRDLVLPLLVVVVVLRHVFNVSDLNLPTNILSTLFWCTSIVLIYRFTRTFLRKDENQEENWRHYIPQMFLQLPSYTVIGVIVFHIIQDLWSLPLKELATTLGIGSIVIAFALQDTLSNLVSGLLLVANSPFKPGEWVHVGDVEGKIVDVNWRYTSIETWNGDLLVVPNGSMSGESIENHSRPTRNTVITQSLEFAYTNPPNKVKKMLVETMLSTPGILHDPEPTAAVSNINDPKMGYEIEFWIGEYGIKPDVHDDLMTRLWYAARRENVSLAKPMFELHNHQAPSHVSESLSQIEERTNLLNQFAHFSRLNSDIRTMIGEQSVIKEFASGETVINYNELLEGIYLVCAGTVHLWLKNDSGEEQLLETLDSRGIFGEGGLSGRARSTIRATVTEDAQILIFSHDLMNDVIDQNSEFASEINSLITRRRTAQNRTIGEQNNTSNVLVSLDSIRKGETLQ